MLIIVLEHAKEYLTDDVAKVTSEIYFLYLDS